MSHPGFSLSMEKKTFDAKGLLGFSKATRLTAYSRQVIAFCQSWLKGQEVFTFHTSGSTGPPQPIHIHRKHMEISALLTSEALHLSAGIKALVCLDIRFIAGAMMLVRGMVNQWQLTLIPPSSTPLTNLNASFDFLSFVPLQLINTLAGGQRHLAGRARVILLGGGMVPAGLAQGVLNLPSAVFHSYGMTETVSHVALRRLNGPKPDAYFHALPGVAFSQDSRGCLLIQTPTAPQLVHTNDVAKLVNETTFEFLGRIDNVVNTGGIKVQAEKIEDWLTGFLPERRFFIAGIPDEHLGEKLTLFVEGEEKLSESALKEYLLTQGANPYELPREFVYVPSFTLTTTGKIDRKNTLVNSRQN
jgi:O-succinylbenzoic acid--CoA ligase